MIKRLFTTIFVTAAVVCLSSCAQAQVTKPAPAQAELAKRLAELTIVGHSVSGLGDEVVNPNAGISKTDLDSIRHDKVQLFTDAINGNKKLTVKQKTFAKGNIDDLIKILEDQNAGYQRANRERMTVLVTDSLVQIYSTGFTAGELTELITFFQTAQGKSLLNYTRIAYQGTNGPTAAEKAENDKFAATPLGTKFLKAFLTDSMTSVSSKIDEIMNVALGQGMDSMNEKNLNALAEKYVTDKYRP